MNVINNARSGRILTTMYVKAEDRSHARTLWFHSKSFYSHETPTLVDRWTKCIEQLGH